MKQKLKMKNLTAFNYLKQKIYFLVILLFLIAPFPLSAQWEIGANTGTVLPITGIEGVLKSGWLIGAEGKYRFGKGNFAVGMKAHFTRLQKDKKPNDAFHNAKMTIAPLIFTAEYEVTTNSKIRPYVGAGMGIAFYNFHYDISFTEGKAINTTSFTLSPQAGLRYAVTDHILPFIESNFILLTDGPPQGFPKAEKLSGYNAITVGVNYRF